MESVISIIGSIASIFGAIWALREARKAKNAAEKAERLRDDLIHRRKMVEVSQVHAETRRILSVVSKVGPSCNAKLLKGVNCADIARQVNEYVSYLLEQSEHFSNSFENKARALCSELRSDIETLSEAISFEDKKNYGKSIYYKIQGFMPVVKQLSDEKQERAVND
jgi:gas vesicle protein